MISSAKLTPQEIVEYRSVPIDGEYLDVRITQSSKYGVPWSGSKKDRPGDYFDNIMTVINYRNHNKEIVIIVSGKSREENIQLLVNGKEIDFPDKVNVLSMNKTFIKDEMYILEHIIRRNLLINSVNLEKSHLSHSQSLVTPYVRVFTGNRFAGTYPNLQKFPNEDQDNAIIDFQKVIEPYLNDMKFSSKKIIIPIVQRTKEKDKGHHWYLCIIELDKNNCPVGTVIDSTAKRDKLTEEEIKQEYSAMLSALNFSLEKANLTPIELENIRYAEIKQYGNMGCGISTTCSIQEYIKNPLRIESIISEKKSQSGDLVTETLRRVELALVLHRRHEFNKSIHQAHINKKSSMKNYSLKSKNKFLFKNKTLPVNDPTMVHKKENNDFIHTSKKKK